MAHSRRRFLCAAVAGAPLLVLGQPHRQPPPDGKYRVVLRMVWSANYQTDIKPSFDEAVARALAQLGFVEGRNLELVRHHLPDATPERRQKMLAELTSSRVDAVVVVGGVEAKRVREATRTVPIVAWSISDPVAMGLAESFRRPGSNLTGLTYGFRELIPKHLHFLRRMVPGLSGVVAFAGGMMRYDNILAEAAAREAGLRFRLYLDMKELRAELGGLRERGFQAAMTVGVGEHARELAEAAIRGGVAMVGIFDTDAQAGMLLSYGEHYHDLVLRIAQVVATLLRGADPAETPFMEPTRFKLIINKRTARALRIEVPADVLVLADEVVDA